MSNTPESFVTFEHQRFESRLTLPRAFATWISRPLMTCLLPVMIYTLFLMLQAKPIAAFAKFGTGIAFIVAAGWTILQLARTPATVSFRNDRVQIRSFLEATLQPQREKWHYVIDVRRSNHVSQGHSTSTYSGSRSSTVVTYGHTSYEFKAKDWNHLNKLTQLLLAARQRYEEKVRSTL